MMPVVRNTSGTIINGGFTTTNGFASLWMASARPYCATNIGESARQRQTIYVRGLKERVQVSTGTGAAYRWRRIVFTFKGNFLYNQTDAIVPWLDTLSGTQTNYADMRRLINLMPSDQYANLRDQLYDGKEGDDWNYEFSAKVDTQTINLLSDKIYTLAPGNDTGTYRQYNIWTPINKNLVYNDDEDGGGNAGGDAYISTSSRPGIGDIYVYDVFAQCNAPLTGTASLFFAPEATFYWHEK